MNRPANRFDSDGRKDDEGGIIDTFAWGLRCLFNYGPCHKMMRAQADAASAWADSTFGIPGAMHANAGSVSDMLTHCVLACEIAKRENICTAAGLNARYILQAREITGLFPDPTDVAPDFLNPESEVDYENNISGFLIADKGLDCKTGCLDWLAKGLLTTLAPSGGATLYLPPKKSP